MKQNKTKVKTYGWKQLSSTVDYQNPYMQVRKDEVIRPDGTVKPFYVLDRGGPFSIIIPLVDRETTFLVGQYRYAAEYYSWEFPMGYVADKKPLKMAQIELKEEVGATAKNWKKIGHFFVANGHSSQVGYIFIATHLKLGRPEPEEGEFLEVKQVKFREIDKMIEKEIILDGPTITAYYYFKQLKLRF